MRARSTMLLDQLRALLAAIDSDELPTGCGVSALRRAHHRAGGHAGLPPPLGADVLLVVRTPQSGVPFRSNQQFFRHGHYPHHRLASAANLGPGLKCIFVCIHGWDDAEHCNGDLDTRVIEVAIQGTMSVLDGAREFTAGLRKLQLKDDPAVSEREVSRSFDPLTDDSEWLSLKRDDRRKNKLRQILEIVLRKDGWQRSLTSPRVAIVTHSAERFQSIADDIDDRIRSKDEAAIEQLRRANRYPRWSPRTAT